jgi:CPA1 family monovalent cation:H+ antiporter
VVLSGIIARALPFALPLPLVQIALGAAIGSIAHLRVELEPHIFFLLFLPPLLFLDGSTREPYSSWRSGSSCSRYWASGCSSIG